jgi:hypothetical protein
VKLLLGAYLLAGWALGTLDRVRARLRRKKP